MLDPTVSEVVGMPHENVTHWGISRREKAGGRETWIRLDAPREDGARIREFPLEALTLAFVRSTWGAGSYKCNWLVIDPDNEQPEHRRISAGHGMVFSLDPEPQAAAPAPPPVVSASGEPMSAALAFAQHLMDLADRRTTSTIEAVARMAGTRGGGGAEESSTLAAKVAEMQAEMRASEERRRIEDAHREALAARDREMAELRRRLEDAERAEPAGPMFQPGDSIWESIGYGILNAAAANPAAAGAVLAPILGRLLPSAEGQAAPPPAAPPAPSAPPPAAPPRRVVVRDLHGQRVVEVPPPAEPAEVKPPAA